MKDNRKFASGFLRILALAVLGLFLGSPSYLFAQDEGNSGNYWTKSRWAPRIGAGAQDRAFLEAGLIRQTLYKGTFIRASKGFYLTTDVFVDRTNLVLAPRTGMEFSAGALMIATDLGCLIDHNFNREGDTRFGWVITPRAGLSLLGFAHVYYGWNLPISSTEIRSLTRNRVGVVFNLNRDAFQLRMAPRR